MRNRSWRVSVSMVLVSIGLMCSCGDGQEGPHASLARRSSGMHSPGLPNWATPAELEIQRRTPPPPPDGRNPPPAGLRLPAEYEPARAVVMTWTTYTGMLQDISVAVAAAGAEVWMVGGPSSISGVPSGRYQRLNYAYDSVWARDYGPYGIDEASHVLGVIDTTYRHYSTRPNDDAIPCEVASYAGANCYSTSLILDGGNVMTDGQGNLFMTKRIYDWNSSSSQAQVNQALEDYYGVTNIYALDYAQDAYGDPADGTGHIDMFAKLLAPCKVLVAESGDSPFAAPLDDAASFFDSMQCGSGQTYTVYRTPGWTSGGVWYTYTNALIVNQTAIIPSYSGADNQAARQVYQQALPGYTVVLVSSDDSIVAGGSVHCITKEIPLIESGCRDSSDCDLPNVDQHSCISGDCGIISCDGGFLDCNGAAEDGCEIQLGSDSNCSACGDDCSAGFAHATGSCQAGACVMGACQGSYADCDGNEANGCEALLGSDTQCSACGDDCTSDYANAVGVCQSGACAMGACHSGYADCDATTANGCETTLGTDQHCSSCSDDCTDNFLPAAGVCQAGICVKSDCDPGYADCDGQAANGCEVELGTDDNCAGCGDVCSYKYAHSVGECVAGSCQIKSCADFYGDCNASAADGCETALGSNQHCSACDDVCADGQDCTVEAGRYHCLTRGCPDRDGDGYGDSACGGTDCDDARSAVNPGATEVCNGADDNCDGNVDEGDVCTSEPPAGCSCDSAGAGRESGLLVVLLIMGLLSGFMRQGRQVCQRSRSASRSR